MKRIRLFVLAVLVWLGLTCPAVQAWPRCGGLAIGVNLGPPAFYRPWGYYPGDYYYYRPYPVYVAPPPVVVQPAPVVVQPMPAQPAARVSSSEPAQMPTMTTVGYARQGEIDRNLQRLADPNEQVRVEAVMQLGKLKVERAVDPVAATLAGDHSAVVRDAAARALGLIGSPRGLTALKYAAQADSDRDVRHSAQFAVEIIHSNMKR